MANQGLKQAVAQKIRSFAELPEGWHFGEGVGATEAAVGSALAINTLLADYRARNIEAFPCVDGGVLVHGYQGTDILEIQCDPDNKVHLVHERKGDLVREQESSSTDDIECYLGELAWMPISSSVFSTQSITAGSWADIPVPPFNRLPQVWDSQCSIHGVESIAAAPNVTIFIISTEGTAPLQLSFGDSARTYYQQDAK